jgi:hypothetical protein
MLQRGEVRGYDFNRMIFEFTMLNQGKVILCAISTAAMDDLDGRRDVSLMSGLINLSGCAKQLRSEHRVSSSKSRFRLIDPWCCDPSISVRLRRQNPLSPIFCGRRRGVWPRKWATTPAPKKPLFRRQISQSAIVLYVPTPQVRRHWQATACSRAARKSATYRSPRSRILAALVPSVGTNDTQK